MRRSTKYYVKEKAKNLRKDISPIERILWQKIRNRNLLNLHVRRQHPIGPYIADFCIEAIRLVIEIDGESHNETQEYDNQRDAFMQALGYQIIRFGNQDVTKNLEGVVLRLEEVCKDLLGE